MFIISLKRKILTQFGKLEISERGCAQVTQLYHWDFREKKEED